ncbi:hypothetical protein CDD82_219 [Ophiocordyceps australis]|uniref:RED-like N-terminal domain-containing protein n=1 Tax=Ophiocordyceps australis TaxID=1399860 RepID=A0A2C5YMP0_9HYPO|nr:hypothetical protein CDD82_219 [Ophiocordyceps australis]
MNNEDFRKLVLAGSQQPPSAKDGPSPSTTKPGGAGTLGLRQRSSFCLTPRAVLKSKTDLAPRPAESDSSHRPRKKFKSSDPKGVGLADGYVDRAQDRRSGEADDRHERLRALEACFRKGEIDKETYDEQRYAIAGGSLDSTHLVKGLDFKLLQRVKRGEDVFGKTAGHDVDEALDEFESKEVNTIEREKRDKKGTFSKSPPETGQHRTRNQILAELKASRAAAKAKQEPRPLGDRFKRIGTKRNVETRIERDAKGREVLVLVDQDGNEKRKVRKLKSEEQAGLLMPDPKARPLGMEVPEQYRARQEAEEEEEDQGSDIFGDVGDDYDPLAGIEASGSDSDHDGNHGDDSINMDKQHGQEASGSESEAGGVAALPQPARGRNYFQDSKAGLLSQESTRAPSLSDPCIAAALKKAAALKHMQDDEATAKARQDKQAMEERRQKLLQMSERDNDDLDMGFGTSRFEDQDDGDDTRVKLSAWGAGSHDEQGGGGQGKRKRGPKKRKGNANSAADVLRVMEQRKRS